MKEEEKKGETLGQQLLDRIEKNKGESFAEVREVSMEMEKDFWKEIESICNRKDLQLFKQFYITVAGTKEPNVPNLTYMRYIITKEITDPCWSTMVFRYTPTSEKLEMIRNIGTPDLAAIMKDNPNGKWDKQLYKDTIEFFEKDEGKFVKVSSG